MSSKSPSDAAALAYQATSPAYGTASPAYGTASSAYSPTSAAYSPASAAFGATSSFNVELGRAPAPATGYSYKAPSSGMWRDSEKAAVDLDDDGDDDSDDYYELEVKECRDEHYFSYYFSFLVQVGIIK